MKKSKPPKIIDENKLAEKLGRLICLQWQISFTTTEIDLFKEEIKSMIAIQDMSETLDKNELKEIRAVYRDMMREIDEFLADEE